MKSIFCVFLSIFLLQDISAQQTDKRLFELRIYYCHPGRLDALIKRFTDHTTRLFEKHGMENIGYWLPVENTDNALYYVLAYTDKKQRDLSWNAFNADSVWINAKNASEADGKIVAKVTSVFMEKSTVSPVIKASSGPVDRLFELRTYTCNPGKLPTLITRFKDHTLKLFSNAGMENIAYWTTIPADSSQPKLVYIVAHKDTVSAKLSWEKFGKDPNWIKARDASEKNGRIIEKLESVMMKPLPFSKIR